MKNKKIVGFIAILAVIGLVIAACINDDGTKPCAHTWDEWTVTTAPTCIAAGTGTRACILCGESDPNTVIPIDSDNHHLVIKSATATCTEEGDVTWKCDRNSCKYEKVETNRSALGHEFINYTETKAANCNEAGSEEAICERDGCDTTDEKIIPINDHHDWEMLTGTPSTCTTHGKGKEKCKHCGEEVEGDNLPLDPFNHIFDGSKWIQTRAATCTIPYEDTEKCAFDTCNALNDDNKKTDRGTVAAAHNFGNWTIKTAATCSAPEKQERVCLYNQAHVEEQNYGSINLTAHDWNWTLNAIAATCTTSNKDTAACENISCTATNERDGNIAALGHDWDNWITTINPITAGGTGEQTGVCQRDCCTNITTTRAVYTITVEADETRGTVEAAAYTHAGATVIITGIPNSNDYLLRRLEAITEEITSSEVAENAVSFSMPAKPVTVRAVFVPQYFKTVADNLAIAKDGTLWAWGYNGEGQLGLGDTTNRSLPTQVGTDNDWVTVSYSCAIKSNGTLWVWGYNHYGQLGLGDAMNRSLPTQLGNLNTWESVSSYYHTMAFRADGTLWAWGYNYYAQLGLGNSGSGTNRNTPTQLGIGFKTVSVGLYNTVAISTNGTLWICGWNSSGELGQGDRTDRNSFVQVGSDNNWATVSMGNSYCLAIKTDGTLWAWGINGSGQLGLGNSGNVTNRNTPTQVGTDNDWVTVSAASSHSLAIKADGTLWAWGSNNDGQLGIGSTSTSNRTSPIQVGTDNDWVTLVAASSSSHSLAIKADGTLWAWGSNSRGQLGQGDTTNRTSPVRIIP